MKGSFRTATERIPPEDVLGVLRDWYRFAENTDPEAETGVNLTFDSTIDEWRASCDLVSAVPLGHWLNHSFGISATDADWKHVLGSGNTLREVCQFISESGAMRSPSGSMQISGVDCSLAGIFVALRSMLSEAGLPLSKASPSTGLTPFFDDYTEKIITTVAKLEPGALPTVEMRCQLPPLILVLGCFLLVAALATKQSYLLLVVIFLFVLQGWRIRRAKKEFGSIVYFPGISTMADLTRAIQLHRIRSASPES